MRIHNLTDWPPELQAAARGDGGASRYLCPACNGGRSRELSLSCAPEYFSGFAIARCWRASCGYFAKVPLDPNAKIGTPQFKPRFFEGELASQGDAVRLLMPYNIGVPAMLEFGIRAVVDKDAVYMPVHGPAGQERGGMLRYFDGTQPKAVSYKATDQPWQAWHVPAAYQGNSMVPLPAIVEDQLSAMRCWQLGIAAVALLGVNLNSDKAAELQQHSQLWKLALDADAFSKALGYAKKYSWLQPVRLEKDLKDSSDAEILERLA